MGKVTLWESIAIIIAFLGVILSFLAWKTSIDQFEAQLQLQKESEFNEHKSNIRSLELELSKNIELMDNILKARELATEKTIHGQLILENLERTVADGKVSNELVKNHTIKAYFDGLELNQRILYVNSPELISLKIENVTNASKDIEHFRKQTLDRINDTYRPSFVETSKVIRGYRQCLEISNKFNISCQSWLAIG